MTSHTSAAAIGMCEFVTFRVNERGLSGFTAGGPLQVAIAAIW